MKNTEIALAAFRRSPGTMTHADCLLVKKFFDNLKKYQDVYRTHVGGDLVGRTLESKIASVEWYIDFHAKREGIKK